jgi:DNA-binding MarR family transcriptional regulator
MTDPVPDASPELDRLANVLGAVAQAVADRTSARLAELTGQSGSAVAALSALHHFLDRPSLDDLRRVLGLTPSGVVRLVDRLTAAGLVTRGPGADGRSRALALTDRGRDLARQAAATRAAGLGDLLAGLTGTDRVTLDRLLATIMAGVVRDKDGGAWICRLCDVTACGRAEGRCPAADAAATKYGAAAVVDPRS